MYRKRGAEQALGYGYGEHQCVAEWLARAELEIVFGELDVWDRLYGADSKTVATLFQKLPNLKIAVPLEEVQYTPPTRDVGILQLPVVF